MRNRYYLLFLLISASISPSTHADTLLITNGSVLIGDDSPASQLDILVENGRIATVAEDLTSVNADRVIDADGRVVSPAFFAGITAAGLSEIGMVYEAVDS